MDPTTSTLTVRWDPAEGNVREYIVIWVPTAGGEQDVVSLQTPIQPLSENKTGHHLHLFLSPSSQKTSATTYFLTVFHCAASSLCCPSTFSCSINTRHSRADGRDVSCLRAVGSPPSPGYDRPPRPVQTRHVILSSAPCCKTSPHI